MFFFSIYFVFFWEFLWECVGLITWIVGEGSSKGVVIVVQHDVVSSYAI